MKNRKFVKSLISLLACAMLFVSFLFPASAGFEQGTLPEVDPFEGDVNGDQLINLKDVSVLFQLIISGKASYVHYMDVWSDGEINLRDVYKLFIDTCGIPKFPKSDFVNSYATVSVGSFGGPRFYDCGIKNVGYLKNCIGSVTYTLNVNGYGSFTKTVNACGATFSFADIGITDEEARNTSISLYITVHCDEGDVNLSCSAAGFILS